jgi:hypothetical protein
MLENAVAPATTFGSEEMSQLRTAILEAVQQAPDEEHCVTEDCHTADELLEKKISRLVALKLLKTDVHSTTSTIGSFLTIASIRLPSKQISGTKSGVNQTW